MCRNHGVNGGKTAAATTTRHDHTMTVQLNHTIVWCRDRQRSAAFLTEILGLGEATRFGPFLVVTLDNDVSVDFHEIDQDIAPQHYAFLIGEADFDVIFARLVQHSVPYWADPSRSEPGAVNHHDGGRGVYFQDPDGHLLEVITRPYGSNGI